MTLPTSGREPGVIFQKLSSPNQLLLPNGVAEVAFVGKSKTTKPVTDESVTRGSAEPTHGTSLSDFSNGTSTSAAAPATSTTSGDTLTLNLDGDGAQTIILATSGSGAAVAADIQAKVQALTAATAANQAAYDDFTAVFSGGLYVLSSGTTSSASTVVVTGGTAAAALKLGTGNGGTEAAGTPDAFTASGDTLDIELDGDGVQTITLATSTTKAAVAADIQAKVRALTAADPDNQYAYANFTATYTTGYLLSSGTVGSASTCEVSGGTAAPNLLLGTAEGGTEAAGAGSVADALVSANVSSVTKLYDVNGVTYFQGTDFLLLAPNLIDWHLGGNRPASGLEYFVTYEVPKVAADYEVKTVYSQSEAEQLYGPATAASNELSVASSLFFQNGGVKLRMVQSDGSDMTAFMAAFDKLAVENLDIVVVLQANTAGFESLFTTVKGRIFQLSQPVEGHERMAFVAPAVGTSLSQYQSMASALSFERMVITAPSSILMTVGGVQQTMPSYFLNAALTGFLADPDNLVSEPLTRKELFGIDDVGTKYLRSQVVALIAAGVLVVENSNGVIRTVQAVTTDTTSVEVNEISLVRIGDFFGKTLSTVLDKIYIGTRLDPTSMASVRTTITTILDNFISKGVLVAFTGLTVTQNQQNPTAIDVFVRVQPVYPLNFISIEFTLELL